MFNVPILLLVFNRPGNTRIVFEEVRKIKPAYIYLAADGPRESKPGEKEICDDVRNIVLSGIDWECEVKTLLRDENLGCGKAVSESITWFFEHVKSGIILEDDCLPDSSFFFFCEEMLSRYSFDERIMHISGDNFQSGIWRGTGDYYFSKYTHIWGWATWKRAWSHYDFEIKEWPAFKADNHFLAMCDNSEKQIAFWVEIFNAVFEKKIDTWDYQWLFTVWLNRGLSILPNKNLIRNIGFGIDATHTTVDNELINKLVLEKLDTYLSPVEHCYNKEADDFSFNHLFIGTPLVNKIKKKRNLFARLKNGINFLKS